MRSSILVPCLLLLVAPVEAKSKKAPSKPKNKTSCYTFNLVENTDDHAYGEMVQLWTKSSTVSSLLFMYYCGSPGDPGRIARRDVQLIKNGPAIIGRFEYGTIHEAGKQRPAEFEMSFKIAEDEEEGPVLQIEYLRGNPCNGDPRKLSLPLASNIASCKKVRFPEPDPAPVADDE